MELSSCVRTIKPGASNPRRDIYDFLDDEFPEARHVTVFRFKETDQPNVGGNHWHCNDERFFIAAGEMTVLVLEDISTKERRVWRNLGAGTLITIPGRLAHANVLRSDLVLVGALREKFDPDDTHPYPLLSAAGEVIEQT